MSDAPASLPVDGTMDSGTGSTRAALLLFVVAWGANHFVPLLLVYRGQLGLSAVDLAVLFGVYAVGLVPGLLVGGPLSDRLGRRNVAVPASCVALVGSATLAFGAAGFPVLLAGRFIVGLGSGATFSAATSWVQDLARSRPPGTGARRAAVALSGGFGAGPLVTSVIAQWAPDPMRLPYVAQGVLLVAAIGGAATARDDARSSGQGRAASRPRALRLAPGFLRFVVPVAPWVFAFPAIAFAVLPSLVREHVGRWAVVYSGAVTAITLFAGVFVQPALRKWPPRTSAAGSLAVGAVGLIAGLAATSWGRPVGVAVAALWLGAAYGGCLNAGLRVVDSTPAADRGYATAVFYVFAYLGFAAPLLQAVVASSGGYALGLSATAAVAALTAVLTATTGRDD